MVATIKETMSQVIKWRRHLHRFPELSFQEQKTSAFVCEHLIEMGWSVRANIGGHGIIADLDSGRPGKRIALRADMDALPIQDLKTVEYASQVPGVMHACGHDGHTASLLGAAQLLSSTRDAWSGSIRLLFQPAEEVNPGGALAMIRDGALDGVDEIYGIHLWSQFPSGHIYTNSGPIMAATDEFSVTIRGKGGHGGLPHEAVDSIAVASHFVVNIQSIVSRNIDPIDSGVISIGSFHGGTTFNVIADECKLQGTVRTVNPETRRHLKTRIEEVLESTCRMFHADYKLNYTLGYPPVVNHSKQSEHVLDTARSIVPLDRVHVCAPMMAAEDFSYYLERIPGCFMFIGAGTEQIKAPHHHPMFDLDEGALEVSVKMLYELAVKS